MLANLHLYANLVMYKMNYFDLNLNIITTIGNSSKGPEKNYSLKGDTENRLFGIFNAVSIIATTYGNGIIPEIQVWISLNLCMDKFKFKYIYAEDGFEGCKRLNIVESPKFRGSIFFLFSYCI